MSTAIKPITFEESLLLPEDKSEEIIDGLPRHIPPSSDEHADTLEQLYRAFSARLDRRMWRVKAFGSGQLIQRQPLTYRVPDFAVYSRQGYQSQHYILSTPELIVELVSPSNRKGNLDELLSHYASIGVPEVWFLCLDRKQVRRFTIQNGEYQESESASQGDINVLGTSLPLNEVWPE